VPLHAELEVNGKKDSLAKLKRKKKLSPFVGTGILKAKNKRSKC
jgi:hypothetical protein